MGQAVTAVGVFARIFPIGTPAAVASAIAKAGFDTTQLNLSVFGRPTLDNELDNDAALAIRSAFESAGVAIWGLSGTFNAVHPDPVTRERAIRACSHLIRQAPLVGADVVTLCSGTRDPENMWKGHAGNSSDGSWLDLRRTLDVLMAIAEVSGVKLGIEPEPGNIIRDAVAAKRLLAETRTDSNLLKIVLDPANLLSFSTLFDQERILSEAFGLLGADVAAIHAKDVVASGCSAPGFGGMDYNLVMRLHSQLPVDVPIIAQDLTEDDAVRVSNFLRNSILRVGA